MGIIYLKSACIVRNRAEAVDIEVNISPGMPYFNIVGLSNSAAKEAKQRIRSAIKSIGKSMPANRITVNIRPAWLKKSGSYYDLPIALGILFLEERKKPLFDFACFGELSLDGNIRTSPQAIALAYGMLKHQCDMYIFPKDSEDLIKNLYLGGQYIRTLSEAYDYLSNRNSTDKEYKNLVLKNNVNRYQFLPASIAKLNIQESAWRAAVISAVGEHHLLMLGPAGSGKTSIARAIQYLLAPLNIKDAMEKQMRFSIAEVFSTSHPFQAPFREIFSSSTLPQIIGGSYKYPYGELSLANKGILFCDEINNLSERQMNAIKSVLDDRKLLHTFEGKVQDVSSDFIFLAAANPCPCGNLFEEDKVCTCTDGEVLRYKNKFNNIFYDRIDLFVELQGLKKSELHSTLDKGDFDIKDEFDKVQKSRAFQFDRNASQLPKQSKEQNICNSKVTSEHIKQAFLISDQFLRRASELADSLHLSIRQFHKLLSVARTIADIDNQEIMDEDHLLEAFSYRKVGE